LFFCSELYDVYNAFDGEQPVTDTPKADPSENLYSKPMRKIASDKGIDYFSFDSKFTGCVAAEEEQELSMSLPVDAKSTDGDAISVQTALTDSSGTAPPLVPPKAFMNSADEEQVLIVPPPSSDMLAEPEVVDDSKFVTLIVLP
jgi:hypothetical protein